MKKFLLFSGLFFTLAAGCSFVNKKDDTVLIGPYLQWATSDGVTVMWETPDSVVGAVIYGTGGTLDRRAAESAPIRIHRVRLEGLRPASDQAYALLVGEKAPDTVKFRTLPADPAASWRLVVYGDSRSDPAAHRRVIDAILKVHPDLVIHTGDFVTDGRQKELWKPEFFDPAAELMKSVAMYPVMGNHENDSEWYYRYFGLEKEAVGKSWYSFDVAGVHFTMLDSDTPYAGWDRDTEQGRWLIDDLQSHRDSRWKIAVFHHPLFSSRNPLPIQPQRWFWHQVLEGNGVSLVFSGHDHHYFRTYPIGMTLPDGRRRAVNYIVTAGGGAHLADFDPQAYGLVADKTYNFTVLDISPAEITERALDASSELIDSFTVQHDQAPEPDNFASFLAESFKVSAAYAVFHSIPVQAGEIGLESRIQLDFQTNFYIPLRVQLNWSYEGDWRITDVDYTRILQPGGFFRLKFNVRSISPPRKHDLIARITLTGMDGKPLFVNHRIDLHPLKVTWDKTVVVSAAAEPPVIDGNLDDPLWKQVSPLTDFFASCRYLAAPNLENRRISARLSSDREHLFLCARIEGRPTDKIPEKREADDPSFINDECFVVALASGEEIYVLGITSGSSFFDSRGDDRQWNSGARYAVSADSSSWSLEMAIPLASFGEHRPEAVNLYRMENIGLLADELNPTYKPLDAGFMLPCYGVDFLYRSAMLPLRFETGKKPGGIGG